MRKQVYLLSDQPGFEDITRDILLFIFGLGEKGEGKGGMSVSKHR
jgi:hypothetical protein